MESGPGSVLDMASLPRMKSDSMPRAGQYYNIIVNRDIKHHNNRY